MIEGIEVLMRHWGAQIGRHSAVGSGTSSALAGLIEWKGAPPRGEPGTRILVGGGALDHRASEVQACVDAVGRQGEQGQRLARLARLRYMDAAGRGPRSVADQMRALEIAPDAERTYYNWVHRLHELILVELSARHAGTMEAVRKLKKDGRKRRKATIERQNRTADRILCVDRSSAEYPPSGSVAPRSAP
ncbi:hypothetical protein [Pseudomonas nitroreducens]|uniref:hypothetical protein n=1 Tax=Pseudomonas nitroreducens TaxID=46680 RepID=UPI003CC823EF